LIANRASPSSAMALGLEINLCVPDLWQQDAVRALRSGQDVVVQAPTGAGKTYIFELLYPSLKGQAIFTVPTRALANDKLAEWRTRGWDIGIATGDLALNLDARVVVATLETQRARFLRREGPQLLVVDEYQLISDEVRGVHYELASRRRPQRNCFCRAAASKIRRHCRLAAADWRDARFHTIVLCRRRNRLGRFPIHSLCRRKISACAIGVLRADLAPVLALALAAKQRKKWHRPLPALPARSTVAFRRRARGKRPPIIVQQGLIQRTQFAVRAG
jgi:hypothetical protein